MFKRSIALATLFESILVLTSCAVGYHRKIILGGYYERAFDDRTYLVGFEGNSLNERSELRDYAEYRAAEIAIREGYTHFTIERLDPLVDTPEALGDPISELVIHLHNIGDVVKPRWTAEGDRIQLLPAQNAEQTIAALKKKYPGKFHDNPKPSNQPS